MTEPDDDLTDEEVDAIWEQARQDAVSLGGRPPHGMQNPYRDARRADIYSAALRHSLFEV